MGCCIARTINYYYYDHAKLPKHLIKALKTALTEETVKEMTDSDSMSEAEGEKQKASNHMNKALQQKTTA